MQKEKPIQPVLDQIAATLRAGRRVWLVGPVPISETPPPEMRPAPENPWGWLDGPYSMIWGAQAGNFIANNARKVESVDLATTNRVIWVENLPLIEVSGWRANF